MLTRIDHIELIVNDVEAMVCFFSKLGFEEVLRSTHHTLSVEMKLPGPDQVVYEIHQIEGNEVPGINHVAFAVDDIEEAHRELTAQGINFSTPPRLVKSSGRVICNTRDAEGWRFQLVAGDRHKPDPE
jgi:glyoxylase I family protein